MTSLKHKWVFILFVVLPIIIFSFAFAFAAHAQNSFNIEFPISELGNCGSAEECRAYCDDSANFGACEAWARANGFADEASVEVQREGGPGDCRSREECDAFCRNPSNQITCIDFAVAKGHMSAEDAARIKSLIQGEISGIPQAGEFGPQVGRRGPQGPGPGEPRIDEQKAARAIAEFGGPGGCADFRACETLCSTSGNEEVCFNYAIEHGLMDRAEAEKFKRLSQIEGPGGCRGRECEAYCEEPGHERECLAFAHEQGFIGDEEFEEINKFVSVIEEKGGPGGCRGRECETFCNNPENRDQCFEFAKSNNLLPPQELERIEKFKTLEKKVQEQGGPGNCRGERECRTYCSDSAHFDECAAFAVKEGFLDPNEAEESLRQFIQIQEFGTPGGPQGFPEGGQRFGPGGEGGFPQGFENIPPEFRQQAEEQFKARFEQFEQFRREFEGRGEGGFPPPQEFPGQGATEGQFPTGGGFPTPSEFPGRVEFPSPNEFPTPGQFPGQQGEFQQQFQGEFQNQFNQEFQRQFEEQFRRESGGLPPPPGSFEPQFPQGSFPPPPGSEFQGFNAQECADKGGHWVNNQCSFINPLDEAAKQCASQGGEWRQAEGQCIFPPPPTSSGNILNLFANILSIFNPALR